MGKEYRHKVHSSLTISKDSLWCWHCIGLRGRTALKYLIDVEKVPYVEAVREINRIQGGVVHSSQTVSLPHPRAEPEAPRDFKLPNRDGQQLFQVRNGQRIIENYADGSQLVKDVQTVDDTHFYVGSRFGVAHLISIVRVAHAWVLGILPASQLNATVRAAFMPDFTLELLPIFSSQKRVEMSILSGFLHSLQWFGPQKLPRYFQA